jgi:hypothetical protein
MPCATCEHDPRCQDVCQHSSCATGQAVCPDCGGAGIAIYTAAMDDCKVCNGTGNVGKAQAPSPLARWKVVHVPGGEPFMERASDGPWVLHASLPAIEAGKDEDQR